MARSQKQLHIELIQGIAEQLAEILVAYLGEQEHAKTSPEEPRRPKLNPGG